jgi:hypothetical protein
MSEISALSAESNEADCSALADQLCATYGTVQLDWVAVLISTIASSLSTLSVSMDLVQRYAWLLTMLNERPMANVGERLVDYLCERDGAVDEPLHELVARLVERNVVTLPNLLGTYLRPLLAASLDGLRGRADPPTEAELSYVDTAANLLASLITSVTATSMSVRDLHFRARWRSLLSGEAFLDLLRLLNLLLLHEVIVGATCERAAGWQAARHAVGRMPHFKQAFFRQARDGTATVLEMVNGVDGPLRTCLLDQLGEWVGRAGQRACCTLRCR